MYCIRGQTGLHTKFQATQGYTQGSGSKCELIYVIQFAFKGGKLNKVIVK